MLGDGDHLKKIYKKAMYMYKIIIERCSLT